jgi:uncharacterized NAD(P)/FAD-binding protein YdhS
MGRIAVMGAGFSGTLLALHLMRRCPSGAEILLIERNVQFGRGTAYATPNPSHLLNVPAGRMSAFYDRPNDFLEWLEKRSDSLGIGPVTAQSFAPRQAFGAYVRHLLNREMKASSEVDRLKLVHGEAIGAEKCGDHLHIHLDRGRKLQADIAVLAVGNFPPEAPRVADRSFYDSDLYRPDPWAADTFTTLDPTAPVLLIGTGLTMIDATVSLLDRGHVGPIHALSRRGLLPQRHRPIDKVPTPRSESFPTNLVELMRFLRREAVRADGEGADWRSVVDEIRPFTGDVWAELSTADRARFLRHLRPWWDVHRHRIAGAVADRIEGARARGQLRISAGWIRAFESRPEGVAVTYRVRGGTEQMTTLTVARIVNCSGPGCDYSRISHPLICNLLETGLVRPDPFNLGLDVTSGCALKDRRGAISGRLFAVGPVTKGAFWEMTAVPDIRRQCEHLAGQIAMLLKAAPGRPAPRPPIPRPVVETAEHVEDWSI